MHSLIRILVSAALLLAVLPGLAQGQTPLSWTTLTKPVAAGDLEVYVASTSGMAAYGPTAVNTKLYIDKEALDVISFSGLRVVVRRSRDGSRLSAHNSGAVVWFGPPGNFAASDPAGACTVTASLIQPRIVPSTGRSWYCMDSVWVQVDLTETTYTKKNVGTAETGVTVAEYGNGRSHVTKLTFTDLALGAPTAAASLAFGKLLYTLPAGAVVIKSAYMNVALIGSGTTCDNDTPDMGIGTVIATGAVAVLGGTTTFEDILTGQTVANLTGTAAVKTIANQILTIEAAAAHTVHLNVADGWTGACSVTGTGTVVLEWVLLN